MYAHIPLLSMCFYRTLTSKAIKDLPGQFTTYGSSYVNTKLSGIQDNNPMVQYSGITKEGNFSDDKKSKLTFTHNLAEVDNIYSPIYVFLTVWLDINGNQILDTGTEEEEFVEEITIVQYPPMSVVAEWSTLRSIYVNGVVHSKSSDDNSYNVIYNGHRLGNSSGVRNEDNQSDMGGVNNTKINYPMYVISVSAFGPNDKFAGPTVNADGSLNINNIKTDYNYIIGDPRQRTPDRELDYDDSYSMYDKHWTSAYAISYDTNGQVNKDEDGNVIYETSNRKLTYYYPTASEGNSFQIVAPKFRIVSFNNASRQLCTPHGAAMRCATMQEDGFPAGRWRLPTIAEIQYVLLLQNKEVISPVFTSGSSYYASASYSDLNKTTLVTLQENKQSKAVNWQTRNGNNISVRCVYDEWYWGSEREAKPNPNPGSNQTQTVKDYLNKTTYGDEYLFTWGDKQIW